MTNEELKVALEDLYYIMNILRASQKSTDIKSVPSAATQMCEYAGDRLRHFIECTARELSRLRDGTHPDRVMVSREPTEEILAGMTRSFRDFYTEKGPYPPARLAYKSMIAAAQKEGMK